MRYYFAPLEGITDIIYRRLHHEYFPGMDRYYTPFLSPTVHRQLTHKEMREIPPADTVPFSTVPQILTKSSQDFLWIAGQCRDLGYREVNLNLGCPSGTVTAKGKGSGMLKDTEALDAFLNEIFRDPPLDISVKTRIGFSSAEEFPKILDVFNRYPICELTVHPRTRAAFYSGDIDMSAFEYAVANSRAPVCYNGNLCSQEQIDKLAKHFPSLQSVMLGRGLICDPGMLSSMGCDRKRLKAFHDALLEAYLEAFGGSRNAMFRLKEHWHYLICKFADSEKLGKRLRKTTDLAEYRAIADEIILTLPILESPSVNW